MIIIATTNAGDTACRYLFYTTPRVKSGFLHMSIKIIATTNAEDTTYQKLLRALKTESYH